MENKILSKLCVIAGISIALLVPLYLIGAQISTRSIYQAQVLTEISRTSAGSQTIIGPVCVIRYHELVRRVDDGRPGDRSDRSEEVAESSVVVPAGRVNVSGEIKVETRSRGIYHARLFHSSLQLSGEVEVPAGLGMDPSRRILDAEAFLVLPISDPRGITGDPVATVNKFEQRLVTGTVGLNERTGVHFKLGAVDVSQGGNFEFSLPLNLTGTERLAFAPASQQTTVSLKSDWPDPSFQGRFLPISRTVDRNGFEARWQVSALSRDFDRALKAVSSDEDAETFGVEFLEPVNVYSMSARAVSYGILFVALVFAAFFLTEILRRLRIHPLQYLFVGLALAIFFLLLIALSEHVPFVLAYAISASACVALIGAYLSGVLGERSLGMWFAAGLAVLYAILYGVLLSEDNALLMGTVLLFIALGTVMLSTRRIDWYQARISLADEAGA